MTEGNQLPPKLSKADLTPRLRGLAEKAQHLYKEKLAYFAQTHHPPAYIACAPGRINLIGEHTDYSGGFCMPLALEHSTVSFGTGYVHTGKGNAKTTVRIRIASDHSGSSTDLVEERKLVVGGFGPPDESEPRTWVNYVLGVVAQYVEDLPKEGCAVDLAIAYASDVPVGAGLSSSASLEVATAVLLECFMHNMAYSSVPECDKEQERAIRCQRAENEWCHSPCGIMDQYIASAAKDDHLILLDCRSLEVTQVPIKKNDTTPVILIANSGVSHSISDSEYGQRRRECQEAVEAMQQVPLYHVLSLRDATLQDCRDAEANMDETIFKRAKHVVSENKRTQECKTALRMGLWDRVGELMNASHQSLRDDYEVSCEEVDFLVDVAQKNKNVYGSRITGGGFGGCSVSLVKKDAVDSVIEELKSAYKEKYGADCECFTTHPASGARVLAVEVDIKPESEFYQDNGK